MRCQRLTRVPAHFARHPSFDAPAHTERFWKVSEVRGDDLAPVLQSPRTLWRQRRDNATASLANQLPFGWEVEDVEPIGGLARIK